MRLNNFRVSGSILSGLFPVDVPRGRGDNVGTIFTVPAPKNLWGQKIRPKFFAIFDNFRLLSRISPERIYISNIWKKLINRNPFHVGQKKLGELWSTNKKVLEVHTEPPKMTFFGRLHLGHYGVLPPQIFIHTRDWPRLPSAHPNWDRGPPKKNFIVKIKNRA